MSKIVFINYHYFEDRRGGGISSAISNLLLNLNGNLEYSVISFCNETGIKKPILFYLLLFKAIYISRNKFIYLSGLFNFHSNIIPIILVRLSRKRLIISPRGMLKPSALNKSKKKLLFLKFVKFLFKSSTRIHITDKVEESESIYFFPTFKHSKILDFPPPRINKFPYRSKEIGEISLLYIGRVDELKNLYSVLVILKDFSNLLKNNQLNSTKKVKFTIIGQKSDLRYFEKCNKLIDEIIDLNEININYLDFVPYNEIEKFFLDHHIFLSLSKGENFGYTIAESLANAMPVIISPNSPFGNLFELKIGSVVNEDDLNKVYNEILFY